MTMTRLRTAAVAVFAVAGMLGASACSSSTPGKGQVAGPRSPLPSVSQDSTSSVPTDLPTQGGTGKGDPAFCAKIVESMGKLSGLAGNAGDMGKLREALQQMSAFYKDLEKAAPDELKQPLAHMVAAMDAAAKALANPSSSDAMQKVSDLMTQLPEDAAKVSEYIATACTGS